MARIKNDDVSEQVVTIDDLATQQNRALSGRKQVRRPNGELAVLVRRPVANKIVGKDITPFVQAGLIGYVQATDGTGFKLYLQEDCEAVASRLKA